MDESDRKRLREILSQKPELSKFFQAENNEQEEKEKKGEKNQFKTIISQNQNNNDNLFYQHNQKKEKLEEDKILNESFLNLRKHSPEVLADYEVQKHMKNLKFIGEYNRWSLKLVQKWLSEFYSSNKIMI
jgi:hypothetical protein